MSTLTFPSIARMNARLLHESLSGRESEILPDEAKALIELCAFIGGMIRGFLKGVNLDLSDGVNSRSLRAKLADGIATTAGLVEDFGELQERLDCSLDVSESLSQSLGNLIAEAERVHAELLAMAEWVDSPPPPPTLEKLKEASKGPFSRMRN